MVTGRRVPAPNRSLIWFLYLLSYSNLVPHTSIARLYDWPQAIHCTENNISMSCRRAIGAVIMTDVIDRALMRQDRLSYKEAGDHLMAVFNKTEEWLPTKTETTPISQ